MRGATGDLPPAPCPDDTNGNRVIDFNDIVTVLGLWQSMCP